MDTEQRLSLVKELGGKAEIGALDTVIMLARGPSIPETRGFEVKKSR